MNENRPCLQNPAEAQELRRYAAELTTLSKPDQHRLLYSLDARGVHPLDMFRASQAVEAFHQQPVTVPMLGETSPSPTSMVEFVTHQTGLSQALAEKNLRAHMGAASALRGPRELDFNWGEPVDASEMVQSFRPEVAAMQRRRAERMGKPLVVAEPQV